MLLLSSPAAGVEHTDYHPFLPGVLDDPYPYYRRLLPGGPVYYNSRRNIWIISRYDDVRATGVPGLGQHGRGGGAPLPTALWRAL